MFRRFSLLLMLLCLLGACSPQANVRLIYVPAQTTALPSPGAARITVVQFEDKRPRAEIGEQSNGQRFFASSPVADWVTRSLADEVSRMGPQVAYTSNVSQAQAGNPQFLVTGKVLEVWVRQNSTTSYTATIRIAFSVGKRNGVVYSENLSATQERSGIPSSSMVENLLNSTLRELLSTATPKIVDAVGK